MNLPILTAKQVRAVDQFAIAQLGLSGAVLMENAGRGAVDIMLAQNCPEPFVICCGKGNNGGDGFVIARHLALRHKQVRVLIWSQASDLTGDAATNYTAMSRCDIACDHLTDDPTGPRFQEQIASAGTIVDALLGTGATGDPRPPLNEVIRLLNNSPAQRVAIDLPSGIDCDTGECGEPTFRADHTITFVAAKPGLISEHAAAVVGQLHISDIGIPNSMVQESLAKSD